MTSQLPNEASGLSLLSLSAVAASAVPIPLNSASESTELSLGGSYTGPGSAGCSGGIAQPAGMGRHRRLSSTGKAKRRLSDARDAASRPTATSLQTAAAALTTLSHSSSPPTHAQGLPSTSFSSFRTASAIPIPNSRNHHPSGAHSQSALPDDGAEDQSPPDVTKGGKKRGTIFTCESCSKVYRHPSCLIKHRWEHSPQWREASKFVLSKHQQVQLLEAAAILSHLSPDSHGTSLPEDRSLWPSFLSGGVLPPPIGANPTDGPRASSSVPASSVLSRGGPRMHDYPVGGGGLTQLRPGVLGVSTDSADSGTRPVPVPRTPYGSAPAPTSSSPYAYSHSAYAPHSQAMSHSHSYSDGTGGWSLPRSSLRSVSMTRSSASRSPSASASDEPAEVEHEAAEEAFGHPRYVFGWGMKREDDDMSVGFSVREEDEDGLEVDDVVGKGKEREHEDAWDGMDMDMVMD